MKKSFIAASLALAAAGFAPLAAEAQNVAVVNGKPVPKARVDTIVSQVQKQAAQRNQQVPPDLEKMVRDKVVTDEILAQEAERRGLGASAEFKSQMELARQSILIGLLSQDLDKTTKVSDADVQKEYDKFKAQAGATEYKARHILVEKEDEAKAPSSRPARSSRTSPRRVRRIPARRRTAATSISPRRARTCPSSRRR